MYTQICWKDMSCPQDIFGGHKQGYQNVGLVLEIFST
jgi:hypothetical protein